MAKLNKKQLGLLAQIMAATAGGGFMYVSKEDGEPLLAYVPPLIQVNATMIDAEGRVAVRSTDDAKALFPAAAPAGNDAGNVAQGTNEVKMTSPYAIINGAVPPIAKRGNKGGGAPTQYPFDTMEIGQSFFVPVSDKHKDPSKTLGSTVSAMNIKYSQETGETKVVSRAKRGPKNKAVLDASGAKIMEDVTVKVRKPLRRFVIRKVEAGVAYGDWKADGNGALITRVAVV